MTQADLLLLSILGEAVELRSPEERDVYLNQACAGDTERRVRVEALLRAHEAAGNFMQGNPAFPPQDGTIDDLLAERPGTVIGAYKLQEQIGEGGMGLVFVADQDKPIRRRVALKVIKPGMDSRQVIARFEAERQALAMMDHPNIARVLDAGTTDNSRPYFVMELVKGVPITQYCDQNRLTTRQRLELFLPVCQAVQHAHQKGIIHRDLKPSNVLVMVHDVTPVVKIIDFGVAKAIGQELTDKSIYTGFAQLVGTPLYMSPEQAGLSGLDVDTRSDIYSLGVLLYELLTGMTPFDAETFKKAGYDEMRRVIREDEPLKPSTRLSTLQAAALATVAEQHGVEPSRLNQQVRGELDWIVMKCLEKDRTRRYETASALARDIERHIHDEPVEACPPSVGYRLRKFLHKHQAGVLAATGFVGMLVAAVAISTWQAWRAMKAEAMAIAERDDKERALAEALAAMRSAEAAAARLRAERITGDNTRITYSPLKVGREFWIAGQLPEARQSLSDGVKLLERRLARLRPGSQEWADCRDQLMSGCFFLGMTLEHSGQPAEAIQAFRRAIAYSSSDTAPWPEIGLARLLASCPNPKWRDPVEALVLAREATARMPHEAHAWSTLGIALYRNGDFVAAISASEKAILLRPSSETGDPNTIDLFFLAMAYWQRGDHEKAGQRYEQAVQEIRLEPLRRERWRLAILLAGAPAGPLAVLPGLLVKEEKSRIEYEDYFFRCLEDEAAILLGVLERDRAAPKKLP